MRKTSLFKTVAVLMTVTFASVPMTEYAYADSVLKPVVKTKAQPAEWQIPADKPVKIMNKISDLINFYRGILTKMNNGGKERFAQDAGIDKGGDLNIIGSNPPDWLAAYFKDLGVPCEVYPVDAYVAYYNAVVAAANRCYDVLYGPYIEPEDPNNPDAPRRRDGGLGMFYKATGDILIDESTASEVFRYEKMAASPFPLVRTPEGLYARDEAGRSAAEAVANALNTRNTEIVNALLLFLTQVESFYASRLTAGGTEEELTRKIMIGRCAYAWLMQRLFANAREGRSLYFDPALIERANKKYEADNKLYAAFQLYANQCYAAHLNTQSFTVFNMDTPKFYSVIKAPLSRFSWFQPMCGFTWTDFVITPEYEIEAQVPQRYGDFAGEQGQSTAQSYQFNTKKIRPAAIKKIRALLGPDCPADTIGELADLHLTRFEAETRKYKQHVRAMNSLVKTLNTILKEYKPYFPYLTGWQKPALLDGGGQYGPEWASKILGCFSDAPVFATDCGISGKATVNVGRGTPTGVSFQGNITNNCSTEMLYSMWVLELAPKETDLYDPAHFNGEILSFKNSFSTSFHNPSSGYEVGFIAANKAGGNFSVKGDISIPGPKIYDLTSPDDEEESPPAEESLKEKNKQASLKLKKLPVRPVKLKAEVKR
jgi:hypothetical protein